MFAFFLLPAGKIRDNKFAIGNIQGKPGKSLLIELDGPKAGVWFDFATQESGDIFTAWAKVMGLDPKSNFTAVLESVAQWLGEPQSSGSPSKHSADVIPMPREQERKQPELEDLGHYAHKWDYWDAEGNLIACVYRYDTPEGKTYRPWDVKAGKTRAPDPRPLYNQAQIATSKQVVLVEGEKSADALISQEITATTAMNGAHAPIDKTDWSPLKDKEVLIWPDNDKAGRDYATRAAEAIAKAGATSVEILQIPDDKSEKWDAFDAVEQGLDLKPFLTTTQTKRKKLISVFDIDDFLDDPTNMPDDLISPRVLTPGGLAVFGGAPKVGKSDFILSWLVHMAAGKSFLGLTPPRPLKIFYLQAELQYYYLRERIRALNMSNEMHKACAKNILITPQLDFILDNDGVQRVIDTMLEITKQRGKFDMLVVDPIRNVFDGGTENSSENDNNAMLFFLQQRVIKIRKLTNPETGIILVHHTKKITKKQLEEDPFQALSGASVLRSYYTSGMLLYRPDENFSERRLMFELRNGPHLPTLAVDKENGHWAQKSYHSDRLVHKDYGEKLDAERARRQDVILQLIFDEAHKGNVYKVKQFAESFDNKAGLGAVRTIQERIGVLAANGYIKFFRNAKDYGLPSVAGSKFGYLCVENMEIPALNSASNDENKPDEPFISIKPTHYKCRKTGAVLPVEDPNIWIYHKEDAA